MLTERIRAARQRLLDGSLGNEASVSSGVVMPIIDALGWSAFDPTQVYPEYRVEGRRVDYALLTRGTPAVFIEVKQPGMMGRADRQLFEYAFHEGVPFAVLTDGATWHFYVPSLQGSYDDRRVYLLDLLERDPAESAERLTRYLAREAVESGEAEERARSDHKRSRQRKGAENAIPQAWANLVAEPRLADLLATEVESVCGFQPETADIAAFLSSLRPANKTLPAPTTPQPRPPRPATPIVPSGGAPSSRLITDLLETIDRIRTRQIIDSNLSVENARRLVVNEIAAERDVTPQTVADAHRRRLRPDITGSGEFDVAVSKWLGGDNSGLKTALLNHAPAQADKIAVERFFA